MVTDARPGAVVVLLTAVAALGIAACGGSSSRRSSTAAATSVFADGGGVLGSRFVAYRRCLEQHACVAKNGYRLPTPNTSGRGPVFPPSIQTDRRYRSAARNCVSIVRPAILRTVRTG
jgi:hypothetical protein